MEVEQLLETLSDGPQHKYINQPVNLSLLIGLSLNSLFQGGMWENPMVTITVLIAIFYVATNSYGTGNVAAHQHFTF